jgi:hypothetical protein
MRNDAVGMLAAVWSPVYWANARFRASLNSLEIAPRLGYPRGHQLSVSARLRIVSVTAIIETSAVTVVRDDQTPAVPRVTAGRR